ncbi:MAG: CatB-related O-acetyltransferase [Flagellimonas sp.]
MSSIKKIILNSQWLTSIAMSYRRWDLKKNKNIRCKKTSFIGFSVTCEGYNGFDFNTYITSSFIGYASYIAANSHIQKTKIGRFCSIGPNVKCIFGRHPSNTFVSTHPSFFSLRPPVKINYTEQQLFEEFAKPKKDEAGNYSIIIGNDVWIGANVSIMDGITIGDGAIVAANALVNKDVPPYTIVGGIPAKPIKKRFDDDDIAFLKSLKWWDKPLSWIKENATNFISIERLKDHLS